MNEIGDHARTSFGTGGQLRQPVAQGSSTGMVASTSAPGTSAPSHKSQQGTAMRKSCQHCRKRKIRCIPSEEDEDNCKACKHKGQSCVFEKQSTMGRPPKSRKREEEGMSPASAAKTNEDSQKPRKKVKQSVEPDNLEPRITGSSSSIGSAGPQYSVQDMLPPIHAPFPLPPEYDWHTQTLVHRPNSYHSASPYTGYPTAFHRQVPAQQIQLPAQLSHADAGLPSLPHANSPPSPANSSIHSAIRSYAPSQSSYTSSPRMSITHDPTHLHTLQTQESVYESFQHESLRSVVSAFSELYSSFKPSSTAALSIPPSLSDPNVPAIAKVRTLSGRAISTRAPHGNKASPSSAEYARSLISPLWDGMPVDIIALTTTGRPSASGPFALNSSSSSTAHKGHAHDEYLFTKLLREDESSGFSISEIANEPSGSRTSPHLQYAPEKSTILEYFDAYYRKHPLAPLLINEKLFREDLAADRVDEALINVIVGSAIARAPCLGNSGGDARDVGEFFFSYIQDTLLSRTLSECMTLATCQALLLWGTHEMAHMRLRRCSALWGAAEILLRERIRRFQARAAEDLARAPLDADGQPTSSSMQWRDIVEQELTVNALWILVVFNTWTSLSMKLPHSTMSILAASLPAPPTTVALSSSFAYSFSGSETVPGSQYIVRRVIERFSDATQLINAIITIGSQAQAKRLFIPDPPRPLGLAGEDAHVANWLLDLARYFSDTPQDQPNSTAQQQMVIKSSISDGSRAFLVVAHAILALQQLLPSSSSSSDHGVPTPLPTIDSLRTALQALHLLSRSITTSTPNSRSRTQALLLDAMPRVLSLLEIFSSSSMESLDHFSLVASHREMITELLGDLSQACEALEGVSPGTQIGLKSAMDRASLNLLTIADMGASLQCSNQFAQDEQLLNSGASTWASEDMSEHGVAKGPMYTGGATLAAILDENHSSSSGSPPSPNSSGSFAQGYIQELVPGDCYTGGVLDDGSLHASGPINDSHSPEDVKPAFYSQEPQQYAQEVFTNPHHPAISHEAMLNIDDFARSSRDLPLSRFSYFMHHIADTVARRTYSTSGHDSHWTYNPYPHMQAAQQPLTTGEAAYASDRY